MADRTTPGEWLAASNPLHKPRTEAEALRAARWGAIALIVQAVWGAIYAVIMAMNPDILAGPMRTTLIDQYERGMGMSHDAAVRIAEAFASSFALSMVVFMGLFTIVYLVLARVMWRKPNSAIPLILLIFAAATPIAWLSRLTNPAATPDLPLWLLITANALFVITTAWMVAAFGGARWLETARKVGGAADT